MPYLKGQPMVASGHLLPWECRPTFLNIGNRSTIFKGPLGATLDPQKARSDFSCRSVSDVVNTQLSAPCHAPVPQYCPCPTHAACFTCTASVALSPFLPKSLANLGSQESLMPGHSQALRLAPSAPDPRGHGWTEGQLTRRLRPGAMAPTGMLVRGRNAQAEVPLACGAGPPWGVQEDSRWHASKPTKRVACHVSAFTCIVWGQGILSFHLW